MKEFKEDLERLHSLEDSRRGLANDLSKIEDSIYVTQIQLEKAVVNKYLPTAKLKELLPWLDDHSLQSWERQGSASLSYFYKVGNIDEALRISMGIYAAPGEDIQFNYRIDGVQTCLNMSELVYPEKAIEHHLKVIDNAFQEFKNNTIK